MFFYLKMSNPRNVIYGDLIKCAKHPIEELRLEMLICCQLELLLNTYELIVYTNVWSPAALASIPRGPIAYFNATHVAHFYLRCDPRKETWHISSTIFSRYNEESQLNFPAKNNLAIRAAISQIYRYPHKLEIYQLSFVWKVINFCVISKNQKINFTFVLCHKYSTYTKDRNIHRRNLINFCKIYSSLF